MWGVVVHAKKLFPSDHSVFARLGYPMSLTKKLTTVNLVVEGSKKKRKEKKVVECIYDMMNPT